MATPSPAASPLTCPRCGRRSVPTGGPFCPHCGRYLAALRWVAEPPPSLTKPVAPRPRVPYTGAPRYRFPPRWGFPAKAWTEPGSGAEQAPGPLQATRAIVGTAVPMLWATSAVALLAAGAEIWRYVLLLESRTGALSAEAVMASDALVTSAGTVAPILAALAGVLVVLWTVRAMQAAADRAGVQPSRSPRALVLGWLVPGVNLSVPGSALAEIEHAALGHPPGKRPRPSRLLLVWWGLWALGVVVGAVTLVWSFRTGVQARADGVVLHAVLDLLAAATAAVTAVVLTRLTRLLGPAGWRRRELVVRVPGLITQSPSAPAGRA